MTRLNNTSLNFSLHISISIFLFLFVLILFLPRFGALDAMGFHWMALAILNIIVSFSLIYSNQLKHFPIKFKPIWFYLGWLSLSALSIAVAYNPVESIVVLSRMLIVLVGIYNLYCLLSISRNNLQIVLWILAAATVVESVYVIGMLFYNYSRYPGIDEIIYFIRFYAGNKNILAASIAVKIPVLFYLIHRTTKKINFNVLMLALFCALSATIILNARATYISVFLQSLAFIGFELYHYLKIESNKKYIRNILYYCFTLIIAVLILQFVFSQIEQSKKTVSYGDLNKRISSIAFTKEGSSSRFLYWEESIDFIKKNPILGGGLGNWKIYAINYEQNYRTSFVCSKHVHNDFLEVAAESGIVSTVVFCLIFISLSLILLQNSFQKNSKKIAGFSEQINNWMVQILTITISRGSL